MRYIGPYASNIVNHPLRDAYGDRSLGTPLSIHAVGDLAPRRASPESIFASVANTLRGSDLRIGHLECPLSNRGTPSPNAKLAMRTNPEVAATLRNAGFDALSLGG